GEADAAALLHIEYTLGKAAGPSPADGAIDVPRDVVLSWKPGVFAAPINAHKVYFSENFNDVNNGIGAITQSDSSYTPPQRLEFSTTYYWRVDEVNNVNPDSPWIGNVWSFTTELLAYPVENITATASSANQAEMGPEKTIDGSGLDANDLHSNEETDMWLSSAEPLGAWIEYEFDKVYKLHEMWVWNSNQVIELLIGFGLRDVTVEYSSNGTDYTTLGTTVEFARASGSGDYAHDTTIDFGGAAAKYVRLTATSNWGGILPQYGLSEVRFLHIPVNATEPYPDSGATGVDRSVVLGWRAGREAVTHDVYVSTDEQAVADGTAPVATVAETSYGPLDLDLGVTHYWRVDEVNEAETITTWSSDIWTFMTSDNIVVDDFESYNDLDPGDPDSKRIFNVWIDGFQVPTNGSLVGYENPPFAEQTIVHGGRQSMPFFYSNTGGAASSEAELTLSPAQNWTEASVATLVVYFQGTAGNTGQLYVKVNGSKVVYGGDAADISRVFWQPWSIDLASLGLNLQSITTLAIGIDGNGASGTLYFDDIGLYVSAPGPLLWFEAEAADSITSPMKTYDDPAASGGKYIGTDVGIGDENDNPPPDGVATYSFTAEGGTYKILLRVIITEGNNSFWVRIPGATNHDPGTHPANPGWIRFNDISDGAEWHWDEVHSNDHDNQVVKITLPAGPHTLEIARREEGALLDAIVISKID
ncbi:MAG: discoidin domain-containing protein, partial [Planctomycetota bacterium]